MSQRPRRETVDRASVQERRHRGDLAEEISGISSGSPLATTFNLDRPSYGVANERLHRQKERIVVCLKF
jgi:hypothetical protein